MAGEIRKSDLIEDKALESIRVDLDAMAVSLEKNDEAFKSIAKTLRSEINPTLEKTSKSIREINQVEAASAKLMQDKLSNEKELNKVRTAQDKLTKTEIRLREKLNQTVKGERDEIIKLQEENRRATKAARENIKATLDQGDAYETLKRDTNKAQLEFKKLATQFGVNSKEATEARRKFELLDQELRQINNAAKDGRRDVGRYGDAIRGVRDTTLKWTAAITGAVFAVRGLFNSVNEQDQINKRLAASFDLTGEALENVSKKVDFLSRAYDTEVNEVIEAATSLTNEFGIESEKAFGLIEQGFAKGANVRGEFLEQLKEYSTQFVNVGLNAEQAIAVITQQENRGVFSDKGIDAIKEAGIRLSEMPKATLDALAAIGFSGEEIQRQITTGQKTVFEVTQDISKELAKLPPNAKEVGTVLADVFGGAGEDAKGFVLSLGDVSTEINDLEDNTTEFEKAQQEIIKQFIDIKQTVSQSLIPAFTFLANNFKTIFDLTVRLTTAFLSYKAVMLALKMKDRVSEFISFRREVRKGSKDIKHASKSAKNFGRSLKAISFTVAISLAIELANSFIKIANGALQAERQVKKTNNAITKGAQGANKNIKELNDSLDERLQKLEDDRRLNKISNDEYLKQKKAEIQKSKEQVEKYISDVKERRISNQKLFFEAKKELREFGVVVGEFDANLSSAELARSIGLEGILPEKKVKILDALDRLEKYKAAVKGTGERIKLYKETLDELGKTLQAANVDYQEFTQGTIEQTKAVEEQTKAYKDLGGEIDNILNAGQSLEEIEDEEIAQQNEAIKNGLTIQQTAINEAELNRTLSAQEAADLRIIIEIEALNDQRKILEQYGRDTVDIDLQISQKRLELSKQFNKDIVDNTTDSNKELFESAQNLQQAITDVLSDQIDKRIDLLNKEADAAKSQQDYLEALAANGNIVAQQSITKNIEIQKEAEAEAARLEKRKQQIQAVSAGLQTFTSLIEDGKSPTEALAGTFTSLEVLSGLLKNINFFEKGTDNAPQGWAVVDEKGAEMITDRKGNIKDLGTDGGARWKYLNAGDKVITAPKTANILNKFDEVGMKRLVDGAKDYSGNSYDLLILQNELKGIRSDMHKLQTSINVDWQGFASGVARMNVHTNKGGDRRTERYTIR